MLHISLFPATLIMSTVAVCYNTAFWIFLPNSSWPGSDYSFSSWVFFFFCFLRCLLSIWVCFILLLLWHFMLLFCCAILDDCINSGFMIQVLSVILSSPVLLSLECVCSYIFVNSSALCCVLVFDISFLRDSSTAFGVVFMCLLVLVITLPILFTTFL